MSLRLIDDLRSLKDVRLHPGADASLVNTLASRHGLLLADEHRAVLEQSNGIEAFAGYIRLFGMQTTESIDAVVWNHPDYWKYARGGRCSGYWCFAETAWGDQYAYSLDQPRAGGNVPVYFLDALSMKPEVVAPSFAAFWQNEFVRSAKSPYDSKLREARQRLGPLEATSNLVYVPSVLLGGTEDISNVQIMGARVAMICNGEIATQLDAGPADGAVKAIEQHLDDYGRMRLRLVWETGHQRE
jgi:hypothetical protein